MANDWEIYFYTKSSNKRRPAKEFLSDLEKKKRVKALDYIELIKNKGLSVGRPYCDKVEGPIYELRPNKKIRLFFSTCKENKIIILSGFIKKQNKIPRREIEKAKRHYQDFKNNPEITLKS